MAGIILLIIALVVPLALILPQKRCPAAHILLPLYIYPETNNTWSPLYDVVEAHPEVKFTVIVNPSSGPGSTQYPNDQYAAGLQQLNAYANVETVGYVRTGYASREINDVLTEVSTYAGWSSKSNGIAVHGIFFDESPHDYSDAAVNFMATVNQAVKNSTGLLGDKTVIHNPGSIPDPHYDNSYTDITVVFEDSYSAFQAAQPRLAALPKKRSTYSYMIHSVPTMSTGSLRDFVHQLSYQAEFLYVTDLSENFYESFGSQWPTFTSVVPT